ncbi:MAG: DUF1998 domain-containing protein [Acidobacteria bacterium]|nr:DUF1998 domain-containing protein [Acidobacteriota bacterium]
MSERSQLRSNQIITTFGPGAMVDLPEKSVIVAGLHEWHYKKDKPCLIKEPRLAAKVGRLLNRPSVELRSPPPAEDLRFTKGMVQPAITGYVFPHWFIVQKTEKTPAAHRRRRLVLRDQLKNGRFFDSSDKKTYSVVPVRFVRACCKGHVGDIAWRNFAHRGADICAADLWIEERGTSGDLSEIWIVCECGANRCMREAAEHDSHSLLMCNGSRPWLDDKDSACDQPNRLLLRNASNAYFPQLLSVISIPDSMSEVDVLVLDLWENYLQFVKAEERLNEERQKPAVASLLAPFTNEQILGSIVRIRNGEAAAAVARSVKDIEFEALSSAKNEAATDQPDGDFFARLLDPKRWQSPWLAALDKIVLVHRLREVTALVGFTRFDSAGPDISGELDIAVERAPLVENPRWMPAAENRGEGFFIQFRPEAIKAWLDRPEVQARSAALEGGFNAWLHDHSGVKVTFPGAAYVMLHSLAHLLITAISLECGYPASSLRERIYAPVAGGSDMSDCYGILIFTGSSDAQGTLGGLVHAARDLKRHLLRACQLGFLCSNDPVCSSHTPGHGSVEQLSGSACHGCLYISETSCEQFNRYLDRSLVVSTIDRLGCQFFDIPA